MIVLLVPACTGGGGPEAGPPSPSANESPSASAAITPDRRPSPGRSPVLPTATPTPAPTDPATSPEEEAAVAEATAALENYLDILNELSLDPSMALAELESIATDDALAWANYTVSTARDQGWTVTGERTFDEIDVTRIQLDAAAADSGYPAVHLDACMDSSAVDALDVTGESALPAGRQTRLTTHWSVWRIDGTWIVAKTGFVGDSVEAAPCA